MKAMACGVTHCAALTRSPSLIWLSSARTTTIRPWASAVRACWILGIGIMARRGVRGYGDEFLFGSAQSRVGPAAEIDQRLAFAARGCAQHGSDDDRDATALDDVGDRAIEDAKRMFVDGSAGHEFGPFAVSETRRAGEPRLAAEGV